MKKIIYLTTLLILPFSLSAAKFVVEKTDGTNVVEEIENIEKVYFAPPIDYSEMVKVEAGSFQMGGYDYYYDGKPIHTVTLIQDFYIGKYEVTQKLWADVMGGSVSESYKLKPKNYIDWYDCIEFCNKLSERDGYTPAYTIFKDIRDPNNLNDSDSKKWLILLNNEADGYRLPTEAQWEYASRGGHLSQSKTRPGASDYIYSGSNDIDEVAWYDNNSGYETYQVGTKSANELGIHDMSGNVLEWCFDWYASYSADAQIDPVGAVQGSSRVIRGGSYDYYYYGCRSANRSGSYPSFDSNPYCGYTYGLRVVRVLP